MDRSSERIHEASPSSLGRGVAVRNNLPFVSELVNFLEHLLPRHLARIVTNVEQVFFQINSDVLNAWKP
jgi:hypothetical protein